MTTRTLETRLKKLEATAGQRSKAEEWAEIESLAEKIKTDERFYGWLDLSWLEWPDELQAILVEDYDAPRDVLAKASLKAMSLRGLELTHDDLVRLRAEMAG